MIKVCHIITKLELGGAQQNTLYTVNHLNKKQFDAFLISGLGGILDQDAKAIGSDRVFFMPELIREISPVNDFIALFKLWKLLKILKPDIVHTHSSKAGILGRVAAFFAGVPVIVHTFHGFGFHDFQKPAVKYFYIITEILTALISDKLIAVSAENINKGLKYYIGTKNKYLLIRSGIETAKYKNKIFDKGLKKTDLSIPHYKKIVTTIGPFKKQKNLADFIKMAGIVSKTLDDVLFLVAGDGALRPELEKLIFELKLHEKVRLLGWRKDIDEILAITDIFVMTSLWEGLPRSILEAMCCELPIVANSVDGVKEIVQHGNTGYLVEPYQIEKMSTYIIELLNNDATRKAFGQNGRKLIDAQFDINKMVTQQESLYNFILENPISI